MITCQQCRNLNRKFWEEKFLCETMTEFIKHLTDCDECRSDFEEKFRLVEWPSQNEEEFFGEFVGTIIMRSALEGALLKRDGKKISDLTPEETARYDKEVAQIMTGWVKRPTVN